MTRSVARRREHAIVTGAVGGIGLRLVERLLARGLAVTAIDENRPALEELTAVAADTVRGYPVDVTDEAAVHGAIEEATTTFGPATRLAVCAGGHGQLVDATALDLTAWRRLYDVHVTGTLITAREFARHLLCDHHERPPGDAAMVVLGSTTGVTASRHQADYGAAKAAAMHLVRVLAMEWADRGVRANVVAAGQTRTAFVRAMIDHGYDVSPTVRRTPMGRLAEVDEVVRSVEFLLFDAAFVTGAVLAVDGGWTAFGR